MFFKVYRWVISPILHFWVGPGFGCRFHPSCSQYAAEAFQVHGDLRGLCLTLRRVGRCHPWGGSGFDPVPDSILK